MSESSFSFRNSFPLEKIQVERLNEFFRSSDDSENDKDLKSPGLEDDL